MTGRAGEARREQVAHRPLQLRDRGEPPAASSTTHRRSAGQRHGLSADTTAGQITVLHHTVVGYPEGWLLAITAGLGFVVALLLVASANSTKGRRARRRQLRRLRHGLEDQVAAPEPDHARLVDAFFGPDEGSHHFDGPARPVELGSEGREGRADHHQLGATPQQRDYPPEPLYEQTRRAAGLYQDWNLPVAASYERRR